MDDIGCKYSRCEGAPLLPSAMNRGHFAIITHSASHSEVSCEA